LENIVINISEPLNYFVKIFVIRLKIYKIDEWEIAIYDIKKLKEMMKRKIM
jgi:hypothetical protein